MGEYPQELVEKVAKAIASDCMGINDWALYQSTAVLALKAAGVEPPKREFKRGDVVKAIPQGKEGIVLHRDDEGRIWVSWERKPIDPPAWTNSDRLTLVKAVDDE